MIELVTIEVTNFRSFSKATFEPLGIGQGMTAINGANGMGKSSIVHALVWALYGITPDGVRVSALRRQDSEGDVEVRVTLRHDGQTIVISRAIRGKNDTTVASIEVDGVEQTNVSSKTATNWIVSRFGLDAEAFLTAFVVRQKELDSLVRARPAERRKTIERLAGIERMSKALDLARGEARLAQKSYDSLAPIPSSTQLEIEKSELENSIAELVENKEKNSATLDEAKSTLSEINNNLENARKATRRVAEIDGKLELEESRLEDLSEKYESAVSLAKLAVGSEELENEQVAIEAKLSDVLANLDIARQTSERIARLQEQKTAQENAIANLNTEKKQLEEESSVIDLETLEQELNIISENLSGLLVLESELIGKKGAARGEWDRLKKAIDTLTSHSHGDSEAKCPTCESIILDVDILLSSLNDSLTKIETEGKQINSDLVATQNNITIVKSELESKKTQAADMSALSERIATLESQISDLDETIEGTKAEIDKLAQNTLNVESLANEKKTLETRQREIITALAKMENALEAKKQLPSLSENLKAKQELVAGMAKELDDAKKEALSYDVELLEEEHHVASEAYREADSLVREASTQIAVLSSQLENIETTLASITTEEDRRKLLLADVEAKTAAATTLDEFRRDRLARLTPELSEVASDFVARMTDGKYTSVLLDEDFTPILTDASGAERPVAWLSGGEESAVALALRVAIGEVLAGQRGGLLVLDEALTAQDASRRQSTMGAIRALPRQIITINHISEATDMVDLVAEVVKAEDGGSTIQEMVPENGRVGAVSDAAIDE